MRYATALVAALALGAAAGIYTPKADAGVVVGVGLPVPVIAPRVVRVPAVVAASPYYFPYAPAIGIGFSWRGPVYGHAYYGPGYRGYYHPGFVHGGYYRGSAGYRR